MGIIQGPSKIPFTDINTLPVPGNSLLTYVLYNSQGLSSGQEFIWSDTLNDYIPVGEVAYNVIGTWNADTNTPDYATELTTNKDALSVSVAGNTNVNGFNKWNVGDLIVRDNNIFFRVPNQADIIFNLDENSVPIFKNGEFENSSISEDENTTLINKEIQTLPGSIILGGFELQERGGFAEDNSNISGDDFIVMDYKVDDSGSSDPIYYKRQAREGQESPGIKPRPNFPDPEDTFQYDALETFSLILQTNSDIFAFYVNFRTPVTGFRFRLDTPNSERAIKYYPSQDDYNAGRGTDFPAGIHKIELETATGTVQGVRITATLQADNDINLYGNPSTPFLNVDRQIYTRVTTTHEENIAEQVFNILEAGENVTITKNGGVIEISSTGGGESFDPAEHSVTEFNDVTNAGGGKIITDQERSQIADNTDEIGTNASNIAANIQNININNTNISNNADDIFANATIISENSQEINELKNEIGGVASTAKTLSHDLKKIAEKDNIVDNQIFTQLQINEVLQYLGLGATSTRELPKYSEGTYNASILYDQGDVDPTSINSNVFSIKIPAKSLTDVNVLRINAVDFGNTGERYIKVFLGDATAGGSELQHVYGENSGIDIHEVGYKIPETTEDIYIYFARQYIIDFKVDIVSSEFIKTNLDLLPEGEKLSKRIIDFIDGQNAIYVSNSGDDNYDGKSFEFPKQTLASAIAAAYALPTQRSVICLDSSTFNENLTINQPVDIFMHDATVIGNIISIANIETYFEIGRVVGTIGIHSFNKFKIIHVEGDLVIDDTSAGQSYLQVDHWESGTVSTGSALGDLYINIANNDAGITIPTDKSGFNPRGFIEGIPINRHHFDEDRYELHLTVDANGNITHRIGTYDGSISISKLPNSLYEIAVGGKVFVVNNVTATASPFTSTSSLDAKANPHIGSLGTIGVRTTVNNVAQDLPFTVSIYWMES